MTGLASQGVHGLSLHGFLGKWRQKRHHNYDRVSKHFISIIYLQRISCFFPRFIAFVLVCSEDLEFRTKA